MPATEPFTGGENHRSPAEKENPGIVTPFQENVATIVLFYTPSARTMMSIFEEYTSKLAKYDLKQLIAKPKEYNFSHLAFSL